MDENKTNPTTIDEYIAQFPPDVQQILTKLRSLILESAPGAEEKISYHMPAFFLNGGLVWFAVWKDHIGFYPRPSGMDAASQDEISAYKGTKGSIHFPLNKPMPHELISKIVKFRAAENLKTIARPE